MCYLSTVQIGQSRSPGGSDLSLRNLVMSLAKLIAFERVFDSVATAFSLIAGVAVAAGAAFIVA